MRLGEEVLEIIEGLLGLLSPLLVWCLVEEHIQGESSLAELRDESA